jgi:MtrB/PioB family decaheme-associated outer membrane protein
MTHHDRVRVFCRSALALAVCAAFAAAQAQEKKEPAQEKSPVEKQASVEVGAAGVTGDSADRAFFGQYNGMRNQNAYGLFNFDYSQRDAATGTWLEILGTNLGLQTRELGLLWKRQGDWQLSASYGELWRVNPYTVNTGVTGIGTNTPNATYLAGGAGSGADQELSTKRKALALGGSKWITPEIEFEARLSSENKSGSRLFGVGMSCPTVVAPGCGYTGGITTGSAVLFYPEPIDSTHGQIEARLNYGGEKLQLSGGYYGSFYSNNNGALYPGVPGVLNNPVNAPLPAGPGLVSVLSSPVALPPDNQYNYFDLGGSYAFASWLRANFKLAYGQGKQNQDFTGAGLSGAPAGIGNLGGEVINKLAQIRLVANPIAKLSLVAEYRYSDNQDNTPVASYNTVGTTQFTNQTVSREVNTGKLEATYRFPWAIQGVAGGSYTSIDRGSYTPTASYYGVSALRETTDETSWWVQLRRSMTETINGSVSYVSSKRDGSNWLAPAIGGVGLVAVTDPASQLGPNAIYMPTLADRDRDKLRFLFTWMATDGLTLQFSADVGRDQYKAPTQYALQESKFDLYTLDVNYALSEAWSLNGYLSTGGQKLNQARPDGYILAFDENSFNVGIGFSGKPTEKLQVGGTLSYINNVDKYAQTLGAVSSPGSAQLLAATGGLPDITFRRTELRLFGKYAISEKSTVRMDAAYQRVTYDDWAYAYNGVPFLYSDNSTVALQPQQNVGYIGVSYIYSWK